MSFSIVIPARMASRRVPGKALADVGGKPILQRVVEACVAVPMVNSVAVVVPHDDQELADGTSGDLLPAARENFPKTFWLYSDNNHEDGLSRAAEAAGGLEAEWIVAVPSDLPFLTTVTVHEFCSMLAVAGPVAAMVSLTPLREEEAYDSNVVKAVATEIRGLCFQREPFYSVERAFRVTGLQAFRRKVADKLQGPKGLLAELTDCEQWRYYEAGLTVKGVFMADRQSFFAVNTPEELEQARRMAEGEHEHQTAAAGR